MTNTWNDDLPLSFVIKNLNSSETSIAFYEDDNLNSSETSITFNKVVDPKDLPDDHWKWNDPCSRLGMPKYSKETEITEQFYQFALLYQPSTTTFDNSKERFRAIKEAYHILLNFSEKLIKTFSNSETSSNVYHADMNLDYHVVEFKDRKKIRYNSRFQYIQHHKKQKTDNNTISVSESSDDSESQKTDHNTISVSESSDDSESSPSLTQEEENGIWKFSKLYSIEDLKLDRAHLCNTENCELLACVTYTGCLGSKWNYCLDCQENDFGGWPIDLSEMPKECFAITEGHKEIMTKQCAKWRRPRAVQTQMPMDMIAYHLKKKYVTMESSRIFNLVPKCLNKAAKKKFIQYETCEYLPLSMVKVASYILRCNNEFLKTRNMIAKTTRSENLELVKNGDEDAILKNAQRLDHRRNKRLLTVERNKQDINEQKYELLFSQQLFSSIMMSVGCTDGHFEFECNSLRWCQCGRSYNYHRNIIQKIVDFKCMDMGIAHPSQFVTYQVRINYVCSLTKAARVPGLVPNKTTLFKIKFDLYDDTNDRVSDVLQDISTELYEIQRKNMFESLQSIQRDELIFLIEQNNACCDDVVKTNIRNEILDNLKDVEESQQIFTVTSVCHVSITSCKWMAYAHHLTRVSSKSNAIDFKMEKIINLARSSSNMELYLHQFFLTYMMEDGFQCINEGKRTAQLGWIFADKANNESDSYLDFFRWYINKYFAQKFGKNIFVSSNFIPSVNKPVVLATIGSCYACRFICKTYFNKIKREYFIDYKYDKMKRIIDCFDQVPELTLITDHDSEFIGCETNEVDVEMYLAVQRVLRRNNRVNYKDSDEDEDSIESGIEEAANSLLQLANGVELPSPPSKDQVKSARSGRARINYAIQESESEESDGFIDDDD